MTAKPKTKAGCPICALPTQAAHRPFCSTRCAQVDLHRWFSGAYAIPGEPARDKPSDLTPGEDED